MKKAKKVPSSRKKSGAAKGTKKVKESKVAKKVLVEKVLAVKEPEVSGFVPMDAEFESDWMSECGKEKGEVWVKPDRTMSAKNVCEVRLVDGTVVAPCYLDGNVYARVDGELSLQLKEVEAVRCYVDASMADEEDDENVDDTYSRDMDEIRDLMGE